jgi:hypothetical protein
MLKQIERVAVLALDDVVELAPGVVLMPAGLADPLRETAVAFNPTARSVIELLPARVGDIAALLSERHGAPPERARADTFTLVSNLDAALLVRVSSASSSAAGVARALLSGIPLALSGAVPVLPRYPAIRVPLAPGSRLRRTGTAARALLPVAARVFAFALVVGVLGLAGASGPAPDALGIALLLAGAMTVGLLIHEAGHVAALPPELPAAIVTRGLFAAVVHPPCPARIRRRAALAGPLASVVLGALVVVAAALSAWPLGLVAALPLLGHLLSLTTLSADGRNAT